MYLARIDFMDFPEIFAPSMLYQNIVNKVAQNQWLRTKNIILKFIIGNKFFNHQFSMRLPRSFGRLLHTSQ